MLPSNSVPPSLSWVARKIAALEAGLREGLASVAASFTGTVADLADAQAAQAAQIAFMLGQLAGAESSPGTLTSINISPATSDTPTTWLSYNATADAAVTLRTSSTGKIAVQAGGYIGCHSVNFATTMGFIGVEVLDETNAQVRPPYDGDGNMSATWGANNYQVSANSGHRHEWTLTPNTLYTLRCRRGYQVGAGSAGATARIDFQGTALAITKIGI